MDWTPVNSWTSALYMVIRSIHSAKMDGFTRLGPLPNVLEDARKWIPVEANYNSVLLAHQFGRGRGASIRRDPNKYFTQIVDQVIKMLMQDLVVIFDQMMDEVLDEHGEKAGTHPQSKVEKLAKILKNKHINKDEIDKLDWARQGCLELIAARNVLVHSRGKWNKKSIEIIKNFVNPPPAEGAELRIGIPMLFRYKKAMRTFINTVAQRK